MFICILRLYSCDINTQIHTSAAIHRSEVSISSLIVLNVTALGQKMWGNQYFQFQGLYSPTILESLLLYNSMDLYPRFPLRPRQSLSFADLLDSHYHACHIHTDNTSQSRFTPENLQQRIERHGGLGRWEDFATYGDDEEMYALGDFVVEDGEEEEEEAAEEFEKAAKEDFYVAKLSDLRVEEAKKRSEPIAEPNKPSIPPEPPQETPLSEPKLRYRSLFSKPISQLLGKISILYQSQRPPAPCFPHGSHKLLDSLAFHIITDSVSPTQYCHLEATLQKLEEHSNSLTVAYIKAILESWKQATAQITRKSFNFEAVRIPMDLVSPHNNEFSAAICRLNTAMQSYVEKAHLTHLLMQKVEAVKELHLAARASPHSQDLYRLLEVAQRKATEYVNANNAFCLQFPKECKKALNVDAVLSEVLAGFRTVLQAARPEKSSVKRAREESPQPPASRRCAGLSAFK